MTPKELEERNKKTMRARELERISPISFAELEKTIKKWLLVPDKGIIKLICAMLITAKSERKPVWLAVIAPSGGGKTALLDGIKEILYVHSVSMLTPQTFLSGMPGKGDVSLLPRISGGVMLMKDFTSILSMNQDARAEIMGQLREIWDGHMKKEFGNGQTREWSGKLTMLVASTQAFDLNQQMSTHLGERFLMYRPIMPDRKTVTRVALKNDHQNELMTTDIANAFYGWWKGIDWDKLKQDESLLPPEAQEEIVNLSNFCTMARSGVIRDRGPQKTVIFVPAAEMPSRMAIQLSSLASGFIAANGGIYDHNDMKIVYKVALDSVPSTNWMVIRELSREDQRTTADIATDTGYPTAPIRLYLENLTMLRVATRIKGSDSEEGGAADKWSIKPEFKDIVRKYEQLEDISKEEKERLESAVKATEEF